MKAAANEEYGLDFAKHSRALKTPNSNEFVGKKKMMTTDPPEGALALCPLGELPRPASKPSRPSWLARMHVRSSSRCSMHPHTTSFWITAPKVLWSGQRTVSVRLPSWQAQTSLLPSFKSTRSPSNLRHGADDQHTDSTEGDTVNF